MEPTRRHILKTAGLAALTSKRLKGSEVAERKVVWPPKPEITGSDTQSAQGDDIILDVSGPSRYKHSGLVLTAGIDHGTASNAEIRVINSAAPKNFTNGFLAIHESVLKHAQIKVKRRDDGKDGVELLIADNRALHHPISSLIIDYPISMVYAVNDKLEYFEMPDRKTPGSVRGGIEDERSGNTAASNLQNAIDKLYSLYKEAGGKTEEYLGNITGESENYENYIDKVRAAGRENNKRFDNRQLQK